MGCDSEESQTMHSPLLTGDPSLSLRMTNSSKYRNIFTKHTSPYPLTIGLKSKISSKATIGYYIYHRFSYVDLNHDLLNQNQACYRCTIGND
jgi:hypothetical protein